MRLDVYIHVGDETVNNKLDLILSQIKGLTALEQQEITKMAVIDDKIANLQQQVASENDVITSAETLLGNLSQMLKDALAGGVSQSTLDQIDAIANSVSAKQGELAQAVAANTPAAPTA